MLDKVVSGLEVASFGRAGSSGRGGARNAAQESHRHETNARHAPMLTERFGPEATPVGVAHMKTTFIDWDVMGKLASRHTCTWMVDAKSWA